MSEIPVWPESEPEAGFDFYSKDILFDLPDPAACEAWLLVVIQRERKNEGAINYIFCSDPFLHRMNVEYLQHDTLTDVITFPYSQEIVHGDIFISIDRVRENADELNIPFPDELHRVMVHGLLHLIGYDDQTNETKAIMRQMEDEYLSLFNHVT